MRFQKWAHEPWQNNMAAEKDVDDVKTCRSALSRLLAWIAGELQAPRATRALPAQSRAEPMPRWAEDMSKNHLQQVQLPESLLFYQRTLSILKERLEERLENLGELAPRAKAEPTPSPTLSDYERELSPVRSRSRTMT